MTLPSPEKQSFSLTTTPSRSGRADECRDGGRDILDGEEVLRAGQNADAGLLRRLPGAALGAQRSQLRRGAVDRHAERLGQFVLDRGGDEWEEVGPVAIADGVRDSGERRSIAEQLRREPAELRVTGVDQRKPAPGVGGIGDEAQVVVDDRRIDRCRRRVDDPGVGVSQQEQEAQQALLVVDDAGDLAELVERQGQ